MHFELEIKHFLFGLKEKLVFAGVGYAYPFGSEGNPNFAQFAIVLVNHVLYECCRFLGAEAREVLFVDFHANFDYNHGYRQLGYAIKGALMVQTLLTQCSHL